MVFNASGEKGGLTIHERIFCCLSDWDVPGRLLSDNVQNSLAMNGDWATLNFDAVALSFIRDLTQEVTLTGRLFPPRLPLASNSSSCR